MMEKMSNPQSMGPNKISVVIPTYNRAEFILETLESVFCQTVTDTEIVVVDDGSTDNTCEILEPLIRKGRIIYVKQNNKGEAAARNEGIRRSSGKYIAFLDSDDLFLPDKLELQADYLDKNSEDVLVHSWYSKFDSKGNDLGVRNTSVFNGDIYPDILNIWKVLIAVPCVMVRAEIFNEIGYFDEDFRWAADLDMWRRITRKYSIGVINKVLSKVRVHPGNISADKKDSELAFEKYLNKARHEDPELDEKFIKNMTSLMYVNVAKTIFSTASRTEMVHVRESCRKALGQKKVNWEAYILWYASFLPLGIRDRLLVIWRKMNYPGSI